VTALSDPDVEAEPEEVAWAADSDTAGSIAVATAVVVTLAVGAANVTTVPLAVVAALPEATADVAVVVTCGRSAEAWAVVDVVAVAAEIDSAAREPVATAPDVLDATPVTAASVISLNAPDADAFP
jgi:hypothetical protein